MREDGMVVNNNEHAFEVSWRSSSMLTILGLD